MGSERARRPKTNSDSDTLAAFILIARRRAAEVADPDARRMLRARVRGMEAAWSHLTGKDATTKHLNHAAGRAARRDRPTRAPDAAPTDPTVR